MTMINEVKMKRPAETMMMSAQQHSSSGSSHLLASPSCCISFLHEHTIQDTRQKLPKCLQEPTIMGNSSASSSGFTWRTDAEDIAKVYHDRAKGKYVVVTGSNVGLGLETARVLSKHGAHVTVACRNLTAGQEAVEKIKKENPDADVELRQLDLASLESVRDFSNSYRESGRPLHLLINNAGIMAQPKAFTVDGFEMQLGVNHIGHFVLTNELLDVLKRSGTAQEPARVINLSSIANWIFSPPEGIRLDDLKGDKNYYVWERYGSSKLANIVFSKELNRRMKAENAPVISVSLHPGVILGTNLTRHSFSLHHIATVFGTINSWQAFIRIHQEPNKTIPQGAATTVLCALAPDVIPGEHYADCAVSDLVHPKGTDEGFARQFWELSEQLTSRKH